MDYRNTFIRVKDHHHYNQVVVAYKKAGAKGNPLCFDKPAYVRCDEDKILNSGGVAIMDEYIVGYAELILLNGSLVPKLDREYKKGDKVRVTATPSPTYPYFSVGDVATLTRFNGCDWEAVFASGEEWWLQPSFGTRYEFFDEPKPKDRRTRITYTEYPDGSREITKIENCLTRKECEKVAPGYLDGTPCYYRVAAKRSF